MDSSFVWILMLAGAAVILLGLVLLASERELKAKRRQIEELLAKLESLAAIKASDRATSTDEPTADPQQSSQENGEALLREVSTLRERLAASEERVRDLEALQQQAPQAEAIENQHRRERQGLEERIAELEGRLLADQGKLSQLQSLSERLAEAQSAQASLREEIDRREAEMLGWQSRIAAAEEQSQRLAALQRPCNDLLSKQAAILEHQRLLQEELAAFARLLTHAQTSESLSPSRAGANSAQAAPGRISG